MEQKKSIPQTGFLRISQVLQFIPICKSTLWARVKARTFPAPIKLGPRVTAWRCEDVRQYIETTGSEQGQIYISLSG